MKAGLAVTTPACVCYKIGAAVPVDPWVTGARKVVFANPGEAGALERILQRSSLGMPRSSLDPTRLGTRWLAGERGVCYATSRREETCAVVRFERR